MEDYDVYVFDWDGTLARTVEQSINIIVEQCRAFGLSVGVLDIAKHFGDWKSPTYFGLPEVQLPRLNDGIKRALTASLSAAPLFPDAENAIRTLRVRGRKVALLTSAHHEVIEAVLAHHSIADLFDTVVTARDVTEPKPHPEGILLVLKRLGAAKEKTLMLGDSVKDLGAAQNAGVDSLLFYPPEHHALYDLAELKKYRPTYVLEAWRDFGRG